jgi:type IV secretory pathway VirB3-like protein
MRAPPNHHLLERPGTKAFHVLHGIILLLLIVIINFIINFIIIIILLILILILSLDQKSTSSSLLSYLHRTGGSL